MRTADLLANRYQILGLIGHGAIGVVYRALDLERQETVALKFLVSPDPAATIRFEREAELLIGLHHPSIPSIVGTLVHVDQPVLVMRHIAGLNLAERLARRDRPFAVRTVLEWADQLLDVLNYVHAHGIVHHDVKPANVKIDATGRLVLLDFGLAGAGAPCGFTASYAPPEQACGGRTGPRSDLYALGATMYELLTRRSPPPAMDRLRTDRLPPLRTLNPYVPGDVAGVVGQALALRDTDRPANAQAMRTALERAAATCPLTEVVPASQVVPVASGDQLTLLHQNCRRAA